MGTTDKVIIIKGQYWVGRVQKFRVEDNLNTVRGVVEELYSSDLVEDRISVVISLISRFCVSICGCE